MTDAVVERVAKPKGLDWRKLKRQYTDDALLGNERATRLKWAAACAAAGQPASGRQWRMARKAVRKTARAKQTTPA